MIDVLPVALRAYAIPPDAADSTETKAETKRTYPHRPSGMFIIDTETTTDPAQLLTFGSARYYVSHHRAADEWALTDEWLFYADDLAVSDAAGCALLSDRVARLRAEVSHPVHLCTRTAFVDGPFWQLAYRARAMVIGFNLPFDLSRLATHWGEGRRVRNPRDPSRMLDGQSGGFTFRMWEHDGADNLYRPRVFIKKLAPGRNLIRFTVPQRADDDDTIPDVGGHQRYSFRGHFLDLHTLAFALTTRRHSLASACETFAVEHGKIAVEEHGVITAEYIDYNRRDVEATYELALKLLAEFDRHPISPDYSGKQPGASAIKPALQATKAYSTASVGKSYLRSMGLIPVLKRQPDFPKHILGRCMAAFYGGRAECRIRNTAVPIVLLDFLSMYPTVNALMDNWRLLIAHRIEIEDATADVRALLARMSLDVVLTPETWRGFCTLVEIIPHGDRLPVRAQYGRHPGWNIGVNPVTSDRPSFYMLPDVVASVILTGLIPEIRSAVRFTAHGIQPGLHPTLLRGQISVNPRTDDLFRTAIETRKSLGNRSDMSEETRASLGQFLKIFANATGYGIFAEMLRRELAIGEHQEVDVYSDCSRFTSQTAAPESPGEYFFSPIAASITAAARLMLAILERLVTDAGGTYVLCDTDSMAIVASKAGGMVACPGGPHHLADGREAVSVLSWDQTETIRQRFAALNPYDRSIVPGSVLQRVYDDATGKPLHMAAQGELRCVAISAKRYVIYDAHDGSSRVVDYGEGEEGQLANARVLKFSEHGLGAYLNPADPKSGAHAWIGAGFWPAHIRSIETGTPMMLPSWAKRMAVRQLTISTPVIARGLAQYNAAAKLAERIRPFSFCLSANVAALFGMPPGVDRCSFHLIGRYERDARRWPRLAWFNLHTTIRRNGSLDCHRDPPGAKFRVVVANENNAGISADGAAQVRSVGSILDEYAYHPEAKSAGADGKPCGPATVGLLFPRSVRIGVIRYIGKETNKLDEREGGLLRNMDEALTDYPLPVTSDDSWPDVLTVLATMPHADVARDVAIDARSLRKLISGERYPGPKLRDQLTLMARAHARQTLGGEGEALSILAERLRNAAQLCIGCGQPLTAAQRTWCSNACRMRTERAAARAKDKGNPSVNETGDHRVIPLPAPSQSSLLARILSASTLADLNAPWQRRRAIVHHHTSRSLRDEEMSQ